MQAVAAELGQPFAMLNVGVLLGELERSDEAIAVYDELLARFADPPNPPSAKPSPSRWSTRASRSVH